MKTRTLSQATICALIAGAFLMLATASLAEDAAPRLFVTVTGESAQAQAMPLVLANQALDQGAEVRVLLCDAGGQLGLKGHQAPSLAPRNITAKDLLARLIQRGVTVEVCALFIPNTEYTPEDLSEGIGMAKPGDVAAWMMSPNTRLFTH